MARRSSELRVGRTWRSAETRIALISAELSSGATGSYPIRKGMRAGTARAWTVRSARRIERRGFIAETTVREPTP